MKKLQIKFNVGSDQYGIILTDNSKLFSQLIAQYVGEFNRKNQSVNSIYSHIEQAWQLFRGKIYLDIENAGENINEILLCFNGEVIIDGERTYFEYF